MKMDSLSQRKQELEKKEVQLKESVVKFDKFLKVRLNFKEECKFYLNIHNHVNYPHDYLNDY